MRILNRIIIKFIRLYQKVWHPIYKGISDRNELNYKICNFNPTCSEYALIAFKKFNFRVAIHDY